MKALTVRHCRLDEAEVSLASEIALIDNLTAKLNNAHSATTYESDIFIDKLLTTIGKTIDELRTEISDKCDGTVTLFYREDYGLALVLHKTAVTIDANWMEDGVNLASPQRIKGLTRMFYNRETCIRRYLSVGAGEALRDKIVALGAVRSRKIYQLATDTQYKLNDEYGDSVTVLIVSVNEWTDKATWIQTKVIDSLGNILN